MTAIGSYERKPIAIIYEEKSAYKDTYAGAEDIVFLEAHPVSYTHLTLPTKA